MKTLRFRHLYITFFSFLGALLCLNSCAKQGSPTGGPIDSLPPVFVKASPPNFTTNFEGDEIKIYFDEYVKLKDYQKQLIISPPLENILISPQGSASKYITITINDTLQDNTTYVFNFGQSIVDNNEENPYTYFKYIMSTGSYIDSLKVTGTIKDALSRTPDDFVTVMLYEADSSYSDSIVYKERPRYVTNTLDSLTSFEITNVKAGRYKLVAMKDEASNFTFQPKKDKIGFVESFIDVPTDSSYAIRLFKETLPLDLSRPRHMAQQRLALGFEGNADSLTAKVLSSTPENFQGFFTERKVDTLNFWFQPRVTTDSLWIAFEAASFKDTSVVKLRSLKPDSLTLRPKTGSTLLLNTSFELESNIPITQIKDSLIQVVEDSTAIPFKTTFERRTQLLSIDFDTQEATQYTITMLPGALSDFYEKPTDSLQFITRTKEFSDYGDIEFTLENAKDRAFIVQLVTQKGELVKEISSLEQRKVIFATIPPANYYIRLIEDQNRNGRYDTGDFLLQRQPEPVLYYPKLIELNAGWLPRETFQLND